MFKKKLYSLSKSKAIFRKGISIYSYSKKRMTTDLLSEMKGLLIDLESALDKKDRVVAAEKAILFEAFVEHHQIKSYRYFWKEVLVCCFFAIAVLAVRQMWFEHYEIPTGSMRPTFKEKDRLLVSKLAYGINKPLIPGHFYFDPSLIQRLDVVTFTSEGLDIPYNQFRYLNIFPSYKRLIKRLIAKPGDVVYFYGGKIYALDSEGNDLKFLREASCLDGIDHIPMLDFEGRIVIPHKGYATEALFKQMNQPLVRVESENKKSWKITYQDPQRDHQGVSLYEKCWGIDDFAMVRLTSSTELKLRNRAHAPLRERADYYLEIHHHPGKTFPEPSIVWDEYKGVMRPSLQCRVSWIPLDQETLKNLRDLLVTARFFVRQNSVGGYSEGEAIFSPFSPKVQSVEDGIYEWFSGKSYKISSSGYSTLLSSDHSLYLQSDSVFQSFFNYGVNFYSRQSELGLPRRFAYFRDGDLYVMGGVFLKKGHPKLQAFIREELDKHADDSRYLPFIDRGPPVLSTGLLNKELILEKGFKIPEGYYLMLGDNHCASADSRDFGLVPETHLQGSPALTIWPFPQSFGKVTQPPQTCLNFPRIVVWLLASTILGGILYSSYYFKKTWKS